MTTLADVLNEITENEAWQAMAEKAKDQIMEHVEEAKKKAAKRAEAATTELVEGAKTVAKTVVDGEGADTAGEELEAGAGRAFEQVEKAKEDIDWDAVGPAVKSALLAVLDVGLDTIMADAWAGWAGLRALADPEQTPPEQVHVVPVKKHVIESEHSPTVDISIGGWDICELNFAIAATLQVDAVSLVVQYGEIMELRPGGAGAGVVIRMAGNVVMDIPLKMFDLPGRMVLEKPVPIRLTDIGREKKPKTGPESPPGADPASKDADGGASPPATDQSKR